MEESEETLKVGQFIFTLKERYLDLDKFPWTRKLYGCGDFELRYIVDDETTPGVAPRWQSSYCGGFRPMMYSFSAFKPEACLNVTIGWTLNGGLHKPDVVSVVDWVS